MLAIFLLSIPTGIIIARGVLWLMFAALSAAAIRQQMAYGTPALAPAPAEVMRVDVMSGDVMRAAA